MINIDDEYTVLIDKVKKENGKKHVYGSKHEKENLDSLKVMDKSISMYIDMEFEKTNIEDVKAVQEVFETINTRGCLASKNTPKQPLYIKESMGKFLLEILNNFNRIKKVVLCNYMKLSNESKNDWKNKNLIIQDKFKDDYDKYLYEREILETKLKNTCYSIFERVLHEFEKINPKFSIFNQWALEYMIKEYNEYRNRIGELKSTIYKLEHGSSYVLNGVTDGMTKGEVMLCNFYKQTIDELKNKDTIDYMLQQLSKSVAKFVNALAEGKELIEKTFIHNEETRNNKFSGIQSYLPTSKIEYKMDGFKFPTPYKYTYEISCIKDFFTISIYQITLNHKVILKCKNCNKYFIPKRTDQVFCSKKCKDDYIRKNMSLGKEQEKVSEYYKKLRKRYNANPIYAKELEKLKTLYKDCKSKQLDDEKIMKILTDFDENVKNTYSVKRGRPPKKQ